MRAVGREAPERAHLRGETRGEEVGTELARRESSGELEWLRRRSRKMKLGTGLQRMSSLLGRGETKLKTAADEGPCPRKNATALPDSAARRRWLRLLFSGLPASLSAAYGSD